MDNTTHSESSLITRDRENDVNGQVTTVVRQRDHGISVDEMPKFHLLSSSSTAARINGADASALQALREAFTPTQPKQVIRLFAGRRRELRWIVAAIEEWTAHVVIYGERGFGKSSLANIVVDIARQAGVTALNCACSSETTFEEMCRGFLRELPLPYRAGSGRQPGRHQADRTFADLLPAGPFGAAELTEVLRNLTEGHAIFRLDEFDRVRDPALKGQLAEAIKNLSDAGARVTFLIVGVAEDLDELVGKHPSIQRNVAAIHLTLMNEEDVYKLIRAGEEAAGLVFEDEVREKILALSQGLPYQAQLLCLQSGLVAIKDGLRRVRPEHMTRAIEQVIALAPRGVKRGYERAFPGPAREAARATAFAAALSPCDEYGYFGLNDLIRSGRANVRPDSLATNTLAARLEDLASETNGPAIFKTRGDNGGRKYAFIDPLLRAFIVMHAERGLIPRQ